jgi:hypothetical protein
LQSVPEVGLGLESTLKEELQLQSVQGVWEDLRLQSMLEENLQLRAEREEDLELQWALMQMPSVLEEELEQSMVVRVTGTVVAYTLPEPDSMELVETLEFVELLHIMGLDLVLQLYVESKKTVVV